LLLLVDSSWNGVYQNHKEWQWYTLVLHPTDGQWLA